jgi:hypothetical protein
MVHQDNSPECGNGSGSNEIGSNGKYKGGNDLYFPILRSHRGVTVVRDASISDIDTALRDYGARGGL